MPVTQCSSRTWTIAVLISAVFPVCSSLLGDIIVQGQIEPYDPANWNSSVDGVIGGTLHGGLGVTGGSLLQGRNASLGLEPGVQGSVAVLESNSKWTLSADLTIGAGGMGALTVGQGGRVSNSTAYLGLNPGSAGEAYVHGPGSTWSSLGRLNVGWQGSGTMFVHSGGKVGSAGGTLAAHAGSNATVTIIDAQSAWTSSGSMTIGAMGSASLVLGGGATLSNTVGAIGEGVGSSGSALIVGGSRWANTQDLYVGRGGSATLTVGENAEVVVGGTLYAALQDLKGDAAINTKGAVLDGAFGFTASSANQIAFGTGGVLTLDPATTGYLGAGYRGTGAMNVGAERVVVSNRGLLGMESGSSGSATVAGAGAGWNIAQELEIGRFGSGVLNVGPGAAVASGSGLLGVHEGSSGSVNVSGAGSTWTSSGDVYVGKLGSGRLEVAGGGVITVAKTLYAAAADLRGDGVINANGAVLDGALVFNATVGPAMAFGDGGMLNLALSGQATLGAGYHGEGSISISEGRAITSYYGVLGQEVGSSGSAVITGAGSRWEVPSYSSMTIGESGQGSLTLREGGSANTTNTFLGMNAGSSGAVIVEGKGTVWQGSGVRVGHAGVGSVNLNSGAEARLGAALVGFQAGSRGEVSLAGAGTQMIQTSDMTVGRWGEGVVDASDGAYIQNGIGWIALEEGSVGEVRLSGAGTSWRNTGSLIVGVRGEGAVSVSGGAELQNVNTTLGTHAGASGLVRVSGANSTWESSELTVGSSGRGEMIVEQGAYVRTSNATVGRTAGSEGSVRVQDPGSFWHAAGATISVGFDGKGLLHISNGGRVSSSGGSVGSNGEVLVTGADSRWGIGGGLVIGGTASDDAAVRIEAGGRIENSQGHLVRGTMTVTGAGSRWSNSGDLFIGSSGTLKVSDGGSVTAKTVYGSLDRVNGDGNISAIGAVLDGSWQFASPTLQIPFTGGGTLNLNLNGTGSLGAGYAGKGEFAISGGAQATSQDGVLGYAAGSEGVGRVSGEGSRWTVAQSMLVGREGQGLLEILGGGEVSAGTASIGNREGSFGRVVVSGPGSRWATTSTIRVGEQGDGLLEIRDGARVVNVQSWGWNIVGSNYGSTGMVKVIGEGAVWDSPSSLFLGHTQSTPQWAGTGRAIIADGALVKAASLSIQSTSSLRMQVSGNGMLVLGNDTFAGSITNHGRIEIIADAFLAPGVYMPITDRDDRTLSWSGIGTVASSGGIWDQATRTFTVNPATQLLAGEQHSPAAGDRVVIVDPLSGARVGLSFRDAVTSISAVPLSRDLQDELDGFFVISGWEFDAAGVSSDLLLSFDIGADFAPDDLLIWRHDGLVWSSFNAADLTYSPSHGVASFSVSQFSSYAIGAVPEPGAIMGMLAAAGTMCLRRRRS